MPSEPSQTALFHLLKLISLDKPACGGKGDDEQERGREGRRSNQQASRHLGDTVYSRF